MEIYKLKKNVDNVEPFMWTRGIIKNPENVTVLPTKISKCKPIAQRVFVRSWGVQVFYVIMKVSFIFSLLFLSLLHIIFFPNQRFLGGFKKDSQCNILNSFQLNKKPFSDYCLFLSAPPNADNFVQIGQSETSITLQWDIANNNNFILQFDGSKIAEIETSAPTGQNDTNITLQLYEVNNSSFILQFNGTDIDNNTSGSSGSLNHTVSNLTAGTRYIFTLFTVFENVTSTGVNLTAVTGKLCYSISTHWYFLILNIW